MSDSVEADSVLCFEVSWSGLAPKVTQMTNTQKHRQCQFMICPCVNPMCFMFSIGFVLQLGRST